MGRGGGGWMVFQKQYAEDPCEMEQSRYCGNEYTSLQMRQNCTEHHDTHSKCMKDC